MVIAFGGGSTISAVVFGKANGIDGLATVAVTKDNHQYQHNVDQRNEIHLIHATVVVFTQLETHLA